MQPRLCDKVNSDTNLPIDKITFWAFVATKATKITSKGAKTYSKHPRNNVSDIFPGELMRSWMPKKGMAEKSLSLKGPSCGQFSSLLHVVARST